MKTKSSWNVPCTESTPLTVRPIEEPIGSGIVDVSVSKPAKLKVGSVPNLCHL